MVELACPRQPVTIVSTVPALNDLCEQWCTMSLLAFDTEFMRTRTYYPLPALLQVNDGQSNYLIDPLAIGDLSALQSVMQSHSVIKAIHAGSEDIEVLHRIFNMLPNNLFDTQVAAALLGVGYSMGYANLVAHHFGIELPKGETRSDWTARPLSDSQKAYAAQDVEYLYPLAKKLLAQLEEKKRLAWLEEDFGRSQANFKESLAEDIGFKKFKSGWKYNSRQLEIIKRLYIWRENKARQLDLPKNHVIKEIGICLIAELKPNHIAQLRTVEPLSPREIRQYGKEIIAVVESASGIEEKLLPQRPVRPLSSPQKKIGSTYREQFSELAKTLNIVPQIFVRKPEYEKLVRLCPEGVLDIHSVEKVFTGWRFDLIKETLFSSYE